MRNIEGMPDDPSKLGIDFSSTEFMSEEDKIEKLKQGAEKLIGMEAYKGVVSKIRSLLDDFGTSYDIPEYEFDSIVDSGELAEIDMAKAIAEVLEDRKNALH